MYIYITLHYIILYIIYVIYCVYYMYIYSFFNQENFFKKLLNESALKQLI